MRSPTLTTAAFAAILAYITTLSSGSVGVLATRHADPLYAGAGGRHHGYRPDLAAAVIAHNNRMRAAAAARVAAAAGDSGPEGEDDSPPNGNSSNSAGGPPGTGSGSGPSGSGSGSSGSGSSNGGPHPSSGATLPPECVPISSTHSCAPWTTGYYINKTELALVYGLAAGTTPDPAYWDKLVEAMTGGGDLQAAIWAEWAQCNGYRGAPIQYYRSYVCLTDIFFYSAGCNPGTKISPPLHPDVCDVYKEAVAGLVQDPNACPSLESLSSTLQGPALQDVFDRRTFLLSADQSCRSVLNNYAKSSDATVWGVTADQVSCGFGGNVTVASKYCDDVFEQFHQKPKCCESLSGGSPSASSQSSGFAPPSANLRTDSLNVAAAAAAADGTAAGQDAGSGTPVGAIVGGVAGGAVVIGGALAAFAVVTKRNQNRKQTGKQPATKVAPLSSISTSGGPSMQQVPDAAAMGADYVTLPPGTRFVGILEFQPTNPDEMEVNEGDIIEGKIQFSDGWMKGYNHESQETGLFPSAVVKPLNS